MANEDEQTTAPEPAPTPPPPQAPRRPTTGTSERPDWLNTKGTYTRQEMERPKGNPRGK